MGVYTATLTVTTASVAAIGTSVSPAVIPADNTHTIISRNRSSTATAYVSTGAVGGAAGAGVGFPIPPLSTLTLYVGMAPVRAAGTMDNSSVAGSGLRFDADGVCTIDVMYLNGSGAWRGG